MVAKFIRAAASGAEGLRGVIKDREAEFPFQTNSENPRRKAVGDILRHMPRRGYNVCGKSKLGRRCRCSGAFVANSWCVALCR